MTDLIYVVLIVTVFETSWGIRRFVAELVDQAGHGVISETSPFAAHRVHERVLWARWNRLVLLELSSGRPFWPRRHLCRTDREGRASCPLHPRSR
jgi:hypothetical protein